MSPPRNNAGTTRGRPFATGNPGRPKGARNKATLAAEALMDGEAAALTRKAIQMALGGDPVAMRLCLERILPARKGRPIAIKLPQIENQADILKAFGMILAAVSKSELTLDEATALAGLVDGAKRAVEAAATGAHHKTHEEWLDELDRLDALHDPSLQTFDLDDQK